MTTILSVFFPVLAGMIFLFVKMKSRRVIYGSVLVMVIVNAVISLYAIFAERELSFVFFKFTDNLQVIFKIDSLSAIFGTMVSVLWIFTTLYAMEYMKHEGSEQRFFSFFLMSFGVVLGIAYASNLFTLYIFYEFLTLSTIPLVIHSMDKKANYAGYLYIVFMLLGAALVFAGFVFLNMHNGNQAFVLGGFIGKTAKNHLELVRIMFFVTFMGFGVKAAMLPFSVWLPAASIAPTPVTALIHAVAVVKAGVFAMMRLLYYCYGPEAIRGSLAQKAIMTFAIVTILYGSVMALRIQHIKRRFAYSTISNLSYIVFGIILCSYDGLSAGLLHMLFHAVVKITLFFTAGAILYQTKKEYLHEIAGLARGMPITFLTMGIVSFGLIGVPPFGAFISKWYLSYAAIDTGETVALVGVLALILSEILTALYCFTILKKAFFRQDDEELSTGKDPNRFMTLPLVGLSVLSVVMSFGSNVLIHWIKQVFTIG